MNPMNPMNSQTTQSTEQTQPLLNLAELDGRLKQLRLSPNQLTYAPCVSLPAVALYTKVGHLAKNLASRMQHD